MKLAFLGDPAFDQLGDRRPVRLAGKQRHQRVRIEDGRHSPEGMRRSSVLTL